VRPSTRWLVLTLLLPLAAVNGGCALAALAPLMMLIKNDPSPIRSSPPSAAPGTPASLPSTPRSPAEPAGSPGLVQG
jgi:hypothetical protein